MSRHTFPLVTLVIAAGALPAEAQTPAAGAPGVLITTTFAIPIPYAAALERLDRYYDDQVGRKRDVAFPEIAPNEHFEVWHEIWAAFESDANPIRVTLKRSSEAGSLGATKSWMLDIAGRLNADLPLVFREEAGLASVESEICTSRKELAAALEAQPAVRSLVSWRQSALFVAAAPLTKVVLSSAGLHGMRRLTVTTVDLPSAKSLMAKLQQGAAAPGICGAFSEDVELNTEIHDQAQSRSDTVTTAAGTATLFHQQIDLKVVEELVRSDPAMRKRIAAAQGTYDVRFRVDRAYRKVTLAWSQTVAGSDGSSETTHNLGQTSVPNVRKLPASAAPLTARVHLAPLKTGAFRVSMSGEEMGGGTVPIDERIFWFDGKTFEEPQNPGR